MTGTRIRTTGIGLLRLLIDRLHEISTGERDYSGDRGGTYALVIWGRAWLSGLLLVLLSLVARVIDISSSASQMRQESKTLADHLKVPVLAEFVVSVVTPSKDRETTVSEMQLGFEYNVERIGRRWAVASYWWEIGRNTVAAFGGALAITRIVLLVVGVIGASAVLRGWGLL